jgi:hypothetical protein
MKHWYTLCRHGLQVVSIILGDRCENYIPTFKKLSGFRQFLICGKTLNQKLYTSSTIFVTVVEFVWLCYVTPFYRVST